MKSNIGQTACAYILVVGCKTDPCSRSPSPGFTFEGFRLAILPIGSYEPYWFMGSDHMKPEDAVRVHKMLNVDISIGIHFSTIAEHPQQAVDAHEEDLAAALRKHNVPASQFWLPGFGKSRNF